MSERSHGSCSHGEKKHGSFESYRHRRQLSHLHRHSVLKPEEDESLTDGEWLTYCSFGKPYQWTYLPAI